MLTKEKKKWRGKKMEEMEDGDEEEYGGEGTGDEIEEHK
jgi:hypothetical protein